jgi:hypothetical protein
MITGIAERRWNMDATVLGQENLGRITARVMTPLGDVGAPSRALGG